MYKDVDPGIVYYHCCFWCLIRSGSPSCPTPKSMLRHSRWSLSYKDSKNPKRPLICLKIGRKTYGDSVRGFFSRNMRVLTLAQWLLLSSPPFSSIEERSLPPLKKKQHSAASMFSFLVYYTPSYISAGSILPSKVQIPDYYRSVRCASI